MIYYIAIKNISLIHQIAVKNVSLIYYIAVKNIFLIHCIAVKTIFLMSCIAVKNISVIYCIAVKIISFIYCITIKTISFIYYMAMKTISLIHSNCCKKYITAIAGLVGSGLYSIAVLQIYHLCQYYCITPVSGSEGSEINEERQSKGAYCMWNAQSETSKKNIWKKVNT